MLRSLRKLAFLLSLAFIAGLSHRAHAGDAAAAQALFDQGKKLMGEKKYAEACAKFEESQKQDPGLGTQTNLAICYEALGRTATAWSLYLDVASQAKARGELEREKKARAAAQALEPKLSKVTIDVSSPVDGIEVKRNGDSVGKASWGTPIPVDPGEVKVTAAAPGHKDWETTLKVDRPGEQTVKVPQLEEGASSIDVGPPPGPTGPATGYGPPPAVTPTSPRMKRRSTGMMVGGIITMPVGVITLLTGGIVYAVQSVGEYDIYTGESYGGDTSAGVGLMLAGAALIGGGIALTVVGAKKVPDTSALHEPKVSPIPEVRVGLGSAQLKWQF